MKDIILSLCVFLALCWAAADAPAQLRRRAGERSAERRAQAQKAETSSQTKDAKETETTQAPEQEDAEKAAEAGKPEAEKRGSQQTQRPAPSGERVAGKKEAVEKAAGGKGKGHQQQLRAFEKQFQREQAKHMERQARLTRIRELAVQKGDAEMIARVDKLIAQQQQVHTRKMTRLQQRRALMGSSSAPAESAPPAPKKGGPKKGVEKADEATGEDQDEAQKGQNQKQTQKEGQSQGRSPRRSGRSGRPPNRTR